MFAPSVLIGRADEPPFLFRIPTLAHAAPPQSRRGCVEVVLFATDFYCFNVLLGVFAVKVKREMASDSESPCARCSAHRGKLLNVWIYHLNGESANQSCSGKLIF